MNLQGTGEEWRAMEKIAGRYDAADSATTIRAAKANIEQHRKSDVTIRLRDRAGNPLADRAVRIVQLRNAFPFGDQLWGLDRLAREGRWDHDRARYLRHRFANLLNAATALCYWTERPKNDGPKTEDIQGEPQTAALERCVNWANSERMLVKGHPLFWSIPKCTPDWALRYDAATYWKFAEVRVRNLVARYRGKVDIWDAVNEPLWEAAPQHLADRHWPHIEPIPVIADYIEKVLRWCRAENPEGTYLVNDYGLEDDKGAKGGGITGNDGSTVTAASQRQRYVTLIDELSQRGVAPDAVGLQQHTAGWISHEHQVGVYDEIARTGLPLHVTEFWAHTGELTKAGVPEEEARQMQADYICNYLTCAYGHPSVAAFFFWGVFNSAIQWHGDGMTSSHEITPLYERLDDLLNQQWKTRIDLKTNGDGELTFRGFHGDYTLRYTPTGGDKARDDGPAVVGMPFTVDPVRENRMTLHGVV